MKLGFIYSATKNYKVGKPYYRHYPSGETALGFISSKMFLIFLYIFICTETFKNKTELKAKAFDSTVFGVVLYVNLLLKGDHDTVWCALVKIKLKKPS